MGGRARGLLFAGALVCVLLAPGLSGPFYVPLLVGVSLGGGYLVGSRSAVGVAATVNVLFAVLYLWALTYLFTLRPGHEHIGLEAVILASQLVICGTLTAAGVALRNKVTSAARRIL